MSKHDTDTSQGFLRLLACQGMGLFLLLCSAYLVLVIATYNPTDPSFSHASPALKTENYGGVLGAYISDFLLEYFSIASFILPLALLYHAIQLVVHKNTQSPLVRMATIPLLLITLSVLLHIGNPIPEWPRQGGIGNGGLVGALLSQITVPYLGKFGVISLTSIVALFSVLWWAGISLDDLYLYTMAVQRKIRHYAVCTYRTIKRIQFRKALQIDLPLPVPQPKRRKAQVQKPQIKEVTASKRVEEERQEDLPLDLGDNYALPPLHLLEENTSNPKKESEDALQQNARQLEIQLANFGIKGEVTKICPGPVITIYELEPAPGVKTATIVGLSNDLARAMSATAIRIASIPGRNVIGIELPNLNRQMVTFKELIATEAFETYPGKLTVALGVDTSGIPVFSDIAKMPHALIAGTTGSGKSVAMNAFILSLAYRMSPEQLRFMMIDPKMLELSIYNGIPHLLTPVITDPHKASAALKWVVREMENRYRLMADLGVKNIQSFNAKFAELEEAGEIPQKMVQTGFDPSTGQPTMESRPLCEKALPYIVVVLDELADLMMVAGKEVEMSIARLAQMARASGIHLLIATQRPSVDVITGLIKANVPTRISFSVTSKIDSRTILDSMGAEQLLGRGDMLFMENGSNTLRRLHGAFVSEEECHAIANHLKTQSKPQYVNDIFSAPSTSGAAAVGGGGGEMEENDPLYQEAIDVIAREQKASTSFIQRHLKIGYNRAASIIEKMEADGLVSEANHVGKREVVIKQPPEGGY